MDGSGEAMSEGRGPGRGHDGEEAAEKGPMVPRGMGNLLCMAAEDERLREALLDERETTLERCAPLLSPDEQRVLRSIGRPQLEQTLDRLRSSPQPRRAFLRDAAKAVVALVAGASLPMWLVDAARPAVAQFTRGIRPDPPEPSKHAAVFEGKGWFIFDVVRVGGKRGVEVTLSSDVGSASIRLSKGWPDFKKWATNFTEAARVTGKRDRVMAELKGEASEGGKIGFVAEHWLDKSIYVTIEVGQDFGCALLLPRHEIAFKATLARVDEKLG